MTRARRLRSVVWLTAGALIVFASGLDTGVHALRPALAREGAAPIGGPPPPGGGGTNVALASAGAVASASSTYAPGFPAASVINSDRAGVNWGNGGGWADATPGSFPDWVQVDFAASYSIGQVNVFSVQDTSWAPSDPTSTQTFTAYGVSSFEVQYWTGTAWAVVPGGSVTGNTLVWRTVAFTPVTTQKIRVLVTGAVDGYSRLTEIEAYDEAVSAPPPSGTNVALASAGAVASASSTYAPGFPAASVINSDRAGVNWGNGGGWADATPGSFPDWVQVDFAASYSIGQVNLFSVQDTSWAPSDPTSTQTFTAYGVSSFEVQYWTGTAWAVVPGGSVTENTLVWRTVAFTPVTTQKIRVLVTGAVDGYSRLTEIEAYDEAVSAPPPTGTNVALASAGAVASASSTYASGFPAASVINSDRAGVNWGNGGGWADATPGSFPDSVQVDFAASYTINQVNVFSVQDTSEAPSTPTTTQTFTAYGVRSFDVQYWTGTAWATVPGGSVTGNTLVWRTVAFTPVTTQKIRVMITGAADGYSRLTEIEAYGDGAAPPLPEPPTTGDIVRFLEQSTWGATPDLVEHVRQVGFDAFLTEQFEAPPSSYPSLPAVLTTRDNETCPSGSTCQRDNYTLYLLQNQFFRNGLYGQDQLRQRVAFALHQIIVVSGVDISLPFWYAPYLQILDRHAFGSYRNLLYDITLNAAMGNYLDVTGNTRTRPNENYAREVLQLFSIGTFKLNPDGTQQMDGAGQPVPTYSQTDVSNFARVFTGWVRAAAPGAGILNYVDSMVANEGQHDVAAKALLNGVMLPANQTTAKDTSDAIDNIANDPSIGPYISKSLIQHLVTSNPSPAYVARVTAVFDNDGSGSRGNLRAVVRAILLDAEARGDAKTDPSYGRLRHPAQLILNLGRAFNARSRDLTAESDGVLNGQAVSMGMDLFRPPSVFSYFSPFNGVPGGAGLRGPEFGLLSTATALTRANVINTLVFSGVNVGTNAPNGTALDFSALQALASNPTALVDSLNVLLLHGTMSSAMRSSIVGAVNAVAATNTLKRARTAVYLVATSSQYQVER